MAIRLPLFYKKGCEFMKKKKRDIIVSIMFLTPALILLFCLIIYPVINTVNLSFRSWNGVYGMPKVFVGLKNFRDVVTNANFWKSLLHSMYFLIGGFFILMPLSFVLALIVTSKLKWKNSSKQLILCLLCFPRQLLH